MEQNLSRVFHPTFSSPCLYLLHPLFLLHFALHSPPANPLSQCARVMCFAVLTRRRGEAAKKRFRCTAPRRSPFTDEWLPMAADPRRDGKNVDLCGKNVYLCNTAARYPFFFISLGFAVSSYSNQALLCTSVYYMAWGAP